MILNLLVGTIVISLTVLIHTFGLIAITHAMARLVALFRMHGRRSRVLAMISVVMGLFAVMTAEVWLWAGIYRLLGRHDKVYKTEGRILKCWGYVAGKLGRGARRVV